MSFLTPTVPIGVNAMILITIHIWRFCSIFGEKRQVKKVTICGQFFAFFAKTFAIFCITLTPGREKTESKNSSGCDVTL
jgi:hypothetical protein